MTSQDRSRDAESESGSEYEESDSQQSEAAAVSEAESFSDESDESIEDNHIGEKLSRRPEGPNFSKQELAKRDRAKQLQGCYRPRYRELFNRVIEDTVNPVDDEGLLLEPTLLGVSDWTPDEKADLFATLSVKGRNARHISERLATKSESEVQDFLDLLLKGTVEEHLRSGYDRAVIGHDEIPAAFEVGIDCELALDLAAERLAYRTELKDEEREKRLHGKYWLLTPSVAAELESSASLLPHAEPVLGDSGLAQTSLPPQSVPAAELLHLPNILQLASLFQSSSADGLTSWLDLISSNTERPSIYNTALGDLHTLITALTRRLVCASLFQASSRLRASSRGWRNERELLVRHQDVQAASRILGLKGTWAAYWVNAPRRNRWQVWTRARANEDDEDRARVLAYDDVEAALRKGDAEFEDLANGMVPNGEEVHVESEDSDLDDDNGDDWIDGLDDMLVAEEEYLDALDRQASSAHEKELWDVLAKQTKGKRKRTGMSSPPPKMEVDEEELPPKPKVSRAERAERVRDLRQWRERVTWQPCWNLPKKESFDEVGRRGEARKRRRLAGVERAAEDLDSGEDGPNEQPHEGMLSEHGSSDREDMPAGHYQHTDLDNTDLSTEDEDDEHSRTDTHDTASEEDDGSERLVEAAADSDISMSY